MIYILLSLIAFSVLAWKSNRWALLVIIGLLPTYLIRFNISFVPFTLLEGMVIILFLVWTIQNYRTLPILIRKRTKIEEGSIYLIMAATLAVIVSPNIVAGLGIWKAYFIEPWIFFILFTQIFNFKKDFKPLIYILAASAFAISSLALWQKFNPSGLFLFEQTWWAIPNPFWAAEATRRVTSFYGFPNAIGLYLAPLIILFVGSLKYFKREITKILLILIVTLSFIALIFALSEGALIAVVAGLITLGVISTTRRKYILGGILVLILGSLLIQPVRSYLLPEITFQNPSGQVRLTIWQETWQLLQDQPLTGAGLAGYQQAVAPYHQAKHIEIYQYPHNLILNFWTELGLFGLIAFIWLLVIVFRHLYRQRSRPLTPILIALLVVILVHGLVDVPYFKNDLAIFFWVIVGLANQIDKS